MSVYDLDSGPLINVIKSILDPQPVYETFGYITGFSAIVLWMLPIGVAIRLLFSVQNLSVKAALGEGVAEMVGTAKLYLYYTTAGVALFSLLFYFQSIVEAYGSVEHVERSLSDFRGEMVSAENNADWIESVLRTLGDIGNVPLAPVAYLFYQLSALLYIFVKHFMSFLFALLVVLTYAFGFIAIASNHLPDRLKLIDGFTNSYKALFVWVLIEPIAIGIIWAIQQGAEASILATYGGSTVLTLNVWSIFAGIIFLLLSFILVIIPIAAGRLATGAGMVDTFGLGAAGVTALIANAMGGKVADEASKASGPLAGMMPDAEGTRRRDSAFARAADFADKVGNTDLATAAGAMGEKIRSGLGNLTSSGNVDTIDFSQTSSPNNVDSPNPTSASSDSGAGASNNTSVQGSAGTEKPNTGLDTANQSPSGSESPTASQTTGTTAGGTQEPGVSPPGSAGESQSHIDKPNNDINEALNEQQGGAEESQSNSKGDDSALPENPVNSPNERPGSSVSDQLNDFPPDYDTGNDSSLQAAYEMDMSNDQLTNEPPVEPGRAPVDPIDKGNK